MEKSWKITVLTVRFPMISMKKITAFRSPPVTQNWAPGQALRDNVQGLGEKGTFLKPKKYGKLDGKSSINRTYPIYK